MGTAGMKTLHAHVGYELVQRSGQLARTIEACYESQQALTRASVLAWMQEFNQLAEDLDNFLNQWPKEDER